MLWVFALYFMFGNVHSTVGMKIVVVISMSTILETE